MSRWTLVLSLVLATSCRDYDARETVTIHAPSRDEFAPLGNLLGAHCGTLDCHGSPARNLRVYGVYGLRASGNSVTGSPDTTEDELDATYESLITVDPESLGAVFAESGQDPERWLVLRKTRGTEHHLGGAPLPAGSDGDRCLLAWLHGKTDEACTKDVFGPNARSGETW